MCGFSWFVGVEEFLKDGISPIVSERAHSKGAFKGFLKVHPVSVMSVSWAANWLKLKDWSSSRGTWAPTSVDLNGNKRKVIGSSFQLGELRFFSQVCVCNYQISYACNISHGLIPKTQNYIPESLFYFPYICTVLNLNQVTWADSFVNLQTSQKSSWPSFNI